MLALERVFCLNFYSLIVIPDLFFLKKTFFFLSYIWYLKNARFLNWDIYVFPINYFTYGHTDICTVGTENLLILKSFEMHSMLKYF